MFTLHVARLELLIARRNLWVATSILLMTLFAAVLTLAGSAPSGTLNVSPITIAAGSITTLSVYLVPLIGLLLSFDAIAGETERGTLALNLTYPLSRAELLLGKFLAHFAVLAAAIASGLLVSALLVIWSHGLNGLDFTPLLRLFFTALALGAAFLGIGYAISSSVRQPSVASGLAIFVWLVCVVLYDLGLLGALVADDGGYFTKSVFPWMLVANPADAFRLLNTPDAAVSVLTTGVGAAGMATSTVGQLISILGWPVLALAIAWTRLRRIEP
ncbi:ABC transporter permease subunit [Halocynthiibacter sp. C4]|uniref:ABC transporter permease n=1 Tax=Halocynthiibacter sp. C4 TaxID=2992758 RepID=UPI00237B68A8|nr:ABC transporter permease subunit [Halocynthiibacter sp. C4]MDE0590618.1 ABC transporter permease subunit [Halocynthiibacter sp. C4]